MPIDVQIPIRDLPLPCCPDTTQQLRKPHGVLVADNVLRTVAAEFLWRISARGPRGFQGPVTGKRMEKGGGMWRDVACQPCWLVFSQHMP